MTNKLINQDAINALNGIKKKKESGEEIEPETQDAVEAIEFANSIVDVVMRGRHVDLSFFRMQAALMKKRIKKRSQK